jgi:colanic acid biosynthesis glycosyl transferase WcaI
MRNGVEISRLLHSVPRKMTAPRRATYEASYCAHTILRARNERPDLIIAISPALGGAVAGAVLARRFKCPLVLHVQDLMAMATSQSGLTGASRTTAITARLEGWAFRSASKVAVISDGFREHVSAYGVPDEDIHLVPNWIRIQASTHERDAARDELRWSKDRILLIHTGNMGFKQDLANVIGAAKLVENPSIEFILIGDGSQRRELERQASGMSNVRFLGVVKDSQYALMLAAADVLLINERSSVREMSVPSKLTSYLAAGRPIVAAVSQLGASRHFLDQTNGVALLVEPGNPRDLAATLEDLVSKEEQLTAMRHASRTYAMGFLDRSVGLGKFGELLRQVLASSTSSGANRSSDS